MALEKDWLIEDNLSEAEKTRFLKELNTHTLTGPLPDHHHVWCNGSSRRPVKGCQWCDGPEGLWAKYPYQNVNEADDLASKHFPDAIKRT